MTPRVGVITLPRSLNDKDTACAVHIAGGGQFHWDATALLQTLTPSVSE